MKLLSLIIYLMVVLTGLSISKATVSEANEDWKFINYKKLSREEKVAILKKDMDRELAVLTSEGISNRDIYDEKRSWEEDIETAIAEGTVAFRVLNDQEVAVLFNQLKGLKQPTASTVGVMSIEAIVYEYEPIAISSSQIKTRILNCLFPSNDKRGQGLKCQYQSDLYYYTDEPNYYFSIEGDIEPSLAIEIADNWANRENISGFNVDENIPKYISKMSYSDNTFSLSYKSGDCYGTVGIVPSVNDKEVHIELLDETWLVCP